MIKALELQVMNKIQEFHQVKVENYFYDLK